MSIGKLTSAGVVSAIASSLCCIAPVLTLIAGSGSVAASVSWIEPARPYLIASTVIVLGIAWFQYVKSQKKVDNCGCHENKKRSFWQSRNFLLLTTAFSLFMISFPLYSKFFFPKNEHSVASFTQINVQQIELSISGMGCQSCETEVNSKIYKLPGIIQSVVSYKEGKATIRFDSTKTNATAIANAASQSGYQVAIKASKK